MKPEKQVGMTTAAGSVFQPEIARRQQELPLYSDTTRRLLRRSALKVRSLVVERMQKARQLFPGQGVK